MCSSRQKIRRPLQATEPLVHVLRVMATWGLARWVGLRIERIKLKTVGGCGIGYRQWLQMCLKSLLWRQGRDWRCEESGGIYYLIQHIITHSRMRCTLLLLRCLFSLFASLVRPSAADLHVRRSTSIFKPGETNHFLTTPLQII